MARSRVAILSLLVVISVSCTRSQGGTRAPQAETGSQQLAPSVVFGPAQSFDKATIAYGKGTIKVGGKTLEQLVPTKCGVTAYKVSYQTTNLKGEPVTASGILALPIEKSAGPMLSYQHGTITWSEDAPSAGQGSGEFMMVGMIYATQCYAVVAADYLGYGDSKGHHPYLHAATEASAAADLIKAIIPELKKKGFEWNQQLFLTGYSQGGHATMALHRRLQEIDHVNVTASAPMAGPYYLSGSTLEALKKPSPRSGVYNAFVILSLHDIYGLFPNLSEAVQEPYADKLDSLFDSTHGWSEVSHALPTDPMKLLTPEFVDKVTKGEAPELFNALKENDVYEWVPKAPVRLYQGHADLDVPFMNSEVTYDYMSKRGADIQVIDLGNLDHLQASMPAMIKSEQWFATIAK